jgi:hypothetical protein
LKARQGAGWGLAVAHLLAGEADIPEKAQSVDADDYSCDCHFVYLLFVCDQYKRLRDGCKRFFDLFSLGTKILCAAEIVTEKPESATFRLFSPKRHFPLSIVRAHASNIKRLQLASIFSI